MSRIIKAWKPKIKESEILAMTKQILSLHGYKVYRINNAGTWNGRAYVFHGTKGVPDLIAINDGNVLFVECKGTSGKVSDEQREFINLVNAKMAFSYVITPDNVKLLPDLLKVVKP